MNSIFDYFDYRDFLRDFYNEQKSRKSFFSYRYLKIKIGMDSSTLGKVFKKRLHISMKVLPKLITFLGFQENEAVYFKTLVSFNKSKNYTDYKKYLDQLHGLNYQLVKHIDERYRIFYSEWYYKPICLLMYSYPYRNNPAEFAQLLIPQITAEEVVKSVELLEKYSLIKRCEDGAYRPTYLLIVPGFNMEKTLEYAEYQKQVTSLASDVSQRFKYTEFRCASFCLALSEKNFIKLNALIENFLRDSRALIGAQKPEGTDIRVYQVLAHAFPITVCKSKQQQQQ